MLWFVSYSKRIDRTWLSRNSFMISDVEIFYIDVEMVAMVIKLPESNCLLRNGFFLCLVTSHKDCLCNFYGLRPFFLFFCFSLGVLFVGLANYNHNKNSNMSSCPPPRIDPMYVTVVILSRSFFLVCFMT